MNKKLVSKIALVLMLVVAIIMCVTPVALGAGSTADPTKVTIQGPGDDSGLNTIGGKIIGIIQAIGSIIAVGILVVVGIKYMLGSAEEKADFKKAMIPYLVGAILVFAASQIAGAVYKAVNGLNTAA